jgi:pimeloyl-ACP methyl ester carboxylesterase
MASARFEKGKLTVGRFEIPWAATGQAERTLVCVNGAQQTMGAWGSVVRALSSRGHRVVLFDLPNQGRARTFEGEPTADLEEQLAAVQQVVALAGAGRPVQLIGGSWGAVLCAAHAARHPDTVSRMVLGSFRTSPNPDLMNVVRRGQHLVDTGRGGEMGELFVSTFGRHLAEGMKDRLRAQFATMSSEGLAQLYAQSLLIEAFQDIRKVIELRRIRARTLLINGALDPIVDVENTRALATELPDAEVILVPDAGHFLHLEQPRIVDLYARFFGEGA